MSLLHRCKYVDSYLYNEIAYLAATVPGRGSLSACSVTLSPAAKGLSVTCLTEMEDLIGDNWSSAIGAILWVLPSPSTAVVDERASLTPRVLWARELDVLSDDRTAIAGGEGARGGVGNVFGIREGFGS